MHMRLAARLALPGKGAVCEVNLDPKAIHEQAPDERHLFALRDGVGRDEADLNAGSLNVFRRLVKP